jgi:hypothetical protein
MAHSYGMLPWVSLRLIAPVVVLSTREYIVATRASCRYYYVQHHTTSLVKMCALRLSFSRATPTISVLPMVSLVEIPVRKAKEKIP